MDLELEDGDIPFQATDINHQNVREVVPCHRMDLDRVAVLDQVDPRIWMPIIPDLLDWTCDPNWPSSRFILALLVSNPTTIRATIPYVTEILRCSAPERDDEHQNVLMYYFVMEIDLEFQLMMLDALQDFSEHITDELESDWAWREDVDELIRTIFAARRRRAA